MAPPPMSPPEPTRPHVALGIGSRFIGGLRDDAKHNRALTGLRAWAAFWVLLYHAWVFSEKPPLTLDIGPIQVLLTPLVSMGIAGVTIFFVLSGFLLGLPFAEWQAGKRPRPDIGRYFFHRVARVFPAYYAQLAVLLIVAVLVSGHGRIDTWPDFFRHLLMLFTPPPVGTTPINLVWWTLPIEFSFYLALPALSYLLRPSRWWWLLGVCLGAMWAWRFMMITWLGDVPVSERVYASYQLPGALDMFGLGMFAALLHVNHERLPAWLKDTLRGDRLAVLGLLVILGAIYWLFFERRHYWADNPIFYLWTPTLSLGTALIVLAAARGSRVTEWLFANRLMVYAGLVSYSVYLWHVPVMDWVSAAHLAQPLGAWRFPVFLALVIPAIYAISTLSYTLVERPFIRMRRK